MDTNTELFTAGEAANYFLAKVDRDSGDNISNLKLQKLLYYAQGFHIAMQNGEPLFPDPVVRWDFGPVVPPVYRDYKRFSWQGIEAPKVFDADDYLPETRELLDAVMAVYGQFSAKRLSEMTHEERPWVETPKDRIIPVSLLREFFDPMVQAGTKGESAFGRPVWPMGSFRFQRRKELSKRLARITPKIGELVRNRKPAGSPWGDDEDWSPRPEA